MSFLSPAFIVSFSTPIFWRSPPALIFKAITPMERLEFTTSLSDKDGNKIDPALLGMPPDFPREMRTVVVFKAKGELTELTITEYDWPVGQMMVYSYAGMHQSLDKLGESLAKGR